MVVASAIRKRRKDCFCQEGKQGNCLFKETEVSIIGRRVDCGRKQLMSFSEGVTFQGHIQHL